MRERLPVGTEFYEQGCILGYGYFGQSTLWLSQLENSEDKSLYVIQDTDLDKLSMKDIASMQNALQLLHELDHPALLPVLSAFVTKDAHIWMLYPLYNYGSCYDLLAAEFKNGLPITLTAAILRQVLTALQYLHSSGVVHRALNARHILINDNNQVCLTGLWYAIKTDAPGKSVFDFPEHAKEILPWIAPEILHQSINGYNEKADIYSIGITIVELVTGTLPFSKLTPTEILLQKLHGVIPELPDKATIEIMQSDVSCSQTSLEGLEQTNDVMSSPSPIHSLSAKRVRSLKQLVENCVQVDPSVRLSASELKNSTYMRHMKKKTKELEFGEMLRNLKAITEFIPYNEDHSFLMQMSSVSLESNDAWNFD